MAHSVPSQRSIEVEFRNRGEPYRRPRRLSISSFRFLPDSTEVPPPTCRRADPTRSATPSISAIDPPWLTAEEARARSLRHSRSSARPRRATAFENSIGARSHRTTPRITGTGSRPDSPQDPPEQHPAEGPSPFFSVRHAVANRGQPNRRDRTALDPSLALWDNMTPESFLKRTPDIGSNSGPGTPCPNGFVQPLPTDPGPDSELVARPATGWFASRRERSKFFSESSCAGPPADCSLIDACSTTAVIDLEFGRWPVRFCPQGWRSPLLIATLIQQQPDLLFLRRSFDLNRRIRELKNVTVGPSFAHRTSWHRLPREVRMSRTHPRANRRGNMRPGSAGPCSDAR